MQSIIANSLIIAGAALILIGITLTLIQKHFPIGKLPGDITLRTRTTTIYIPLATSLLLSLLLSILLSIVWFVVHKLS